MQGYANTNIKNNITYIPIGSFSEYYMKITRNYLLYGNVPDFLNK